MCLFFWFRCMFAVRHRSCSLSSSLRIHLNIMFTQFGFSVFTLTYTCFKWTLNCVRTQPPSYRQARLLLPVCFWAVFWSRGFIRRTHKQIRRRWFKPSSVSYVCFLWWGNSRLILWDTEITLKILICLQRRTVLFHLLCTFRLPSLTPFQTPDHQTSNYPWPIGTSTISKQRRCPFWCWRSSSALFLN